MANRIALPILTNNIWLPIAVIVALPAVTVLYGVVKAYLNRIIPEESLEQNIEQITKEVCEDDPAFEKNTVETFVSKVVEAIYLKKLSLDYEVDKTTAPIWNAIIERLRIQFNSSKFEKKDNEKTVTLSWSNPPTLRKTDPEDELIKKITSNLEMNGCEKGKLDPKDKLLYDDVKALLTRLNEKPDYLFFAVPSNVGDKEMVTFAWQKIPLEEKKSSAQTKTQISNLIVTIERNREEKKNESIQTTHAGQLERFYEHIFLNKSAISYSLGTVTVVCDQKVDCPWH